MSTTKTEHKTPRTFASLRFKGDRLEPQRVSEILHAAPTTAYHKGEIYKRSRGHAARGRTGVWLLSSRGCVQSSELGEHLRYLLKILFPGGSDDRVKSLHDMLRDGHIEADVSCFWYGEHGAHAPRIPSGVRAAFAQLPARIETDFHTL